MAFHTHPVIKNGLIKLDEEKLYSSSTQPPLHHLKSICSDTELRNTMIYDIAYKHLEIKDQLAIQLHYKNCKNGIVLSVNTDSHFKDSDIAVMETVKFHIQRSLLLLRDKEVKANIEYKKEKLRKKTGIGLTEEENIILSGIVAAKTTQLITSQLNTAFHKNLSCRSIERKVSSVLKKTGFANRHDLRLYLFEGLYFDKKTTDRLFRQQSKEK